MQKEIEVKVKVGDVHALEQQLAAAGCTLSEGVVQDDTIYINYDRPFIQFQTGDVFLRIRKTKGKAIFTFKQGEEMRSIERETEVANPDQLHDILTFLGFRPEVHVAKTRRKGTWKGYEVCVDQVDGLGAFMELEKITDEDPEQVQATMMTDLASLGVQNTERVTNGYDTLMWLKNNHSYTI